MKLANGNYIRPTARFSWWLGTQTYLSYMMREVSSLFIGGFSVIMVWGLYRLSQGEVAYTAWTESLWNNTVLFSVIAFLFAVYHSFTWFLVTPKAMPLKIAGKRLSSYVIIAAHLLLWLFSSIFVWFVVINGGAA